MDFFLTNKIVAQNSGIEHAEMARLGLFKRLGRQAAIVTYQYANHTHEFLKEAGLADSSVINLFDFFAGTTAFNPVIPSLRTLGLAEEAQLIPNASGGFEVVVASRHVANIEPDQFEPHRWGQSVISQLTGGRIAKPTWTLAVLLVPQLP